MEIAQGVVRKLIESCLDHGDPLPEILAKTRIDNIAVDAAQSDRVVITRHGKPAALIIGLEGADWETVVLETNAEFWELIQQRRRQPTVSLEEMKQRLYTSLSSKR